MEDRKNPPLGEMGNQPCSRRLRGQQHIKKVSGVDAVLRDPRQPDSLFLGPMSEFRFVAPPDLAPPSLDRIAGFQLSEKKSGQDIRGEITGADIDPSILVHLPPQETAPIRTLLAQNFGTLDPLGMVDNQRTPLAADEIFCFMIIVSFLKTCPTHFVLL